MGDGGWRVVGGRQRATGEDESKNENENERRGRWMRCRKQGRRGSER
jgi:hypothetical protein